ncbi:hypothetical protein F4805DRAFT_474058 [Annulohypoxylon moriforme]|nr:hypothetical protein F4805DRAFT_474058 [Annulohypoxylon moriforme]
MNVETDQRRKQTVQDFARFSALAWINKLAPEPLPHGLQDEYVAIFDKLSSTLPDSLRSLIDTARQDLCLIFGPDFPIALHHGDILENNINVEEATGHITGIVDWSDAFIALLGLLISGMEILLGVQDWHLHPSHVDLRQQFWDIFYSEIGEVSEVNKRSIKVARLMGLIRAHGFEENGMLEVYFERLISLSKSGEQYCGER